MTHFAKVALGIESKFERFRYGRGYEKWLRRRCIKKAKGIRCHLCSEPLTLETSTFDHLLPRIAGGHLVPGNVKLACERCNQRRGTEPVDYFKMKTLLVKRWPFLDPTLEPRISSHRGHDWAGKRRPPPFSEANKRWHSPHPAFVKMLRRLTK